MWKEVSLRCTFNQRGKTRTIMQLRTPRQGCRREGPATKSEISVPMRRGRGTDSVLVGGDGSGSQWDTSRHRLIYLLRRFSEMESWEVNWRLFLVQLYGRKAS